MRVNKRQVAIAAAIAVIAIVAGGAFWYIENVHIENVRPGAVCLESGQVSVTKAGTLVACQVDAGWRAAK